MWAYASCLQDADDAIQLPVIETQPYTTLHENKPTPHSIPDEMPTTRKPSMPEPTPIGTDTKPYEDMTDSEKIYHLRDLGLFYNQIMDETGFSKGKIRHHPRKRGVNTSQ